MYEQSETSNKKVDGEGTKAHFLCQVDSNPQLESILWARGDFFGHDVTSFESFDHRSRASSRWRCQRGHKKSDQKGARSVCLTEAYMALEPTQSNDQAKYLQLWCQISLCLRLWDMIGCQRCLKQASDIREWMP